MAYRSIATLVLAILAHPAFATSSDTKRWAETAARVTITRDDWGVAHIKGKTDADAVFGMIYAQAEDDFARIEANYLTALGRTAEAEGEAAIWQDLRARMYNDPAKLQALYRQSPVWLKRLMNAWADGLNFYLSSPGASKPRVITRFEPWMALSFTEGSIGGDIEKIDLEALKAFYIGSDPKPMAAQSSEPETRGSNGIAIGPSKSKSGHPLLLINPHTSFFFRSEQQVTSDEGLNAYGAATWGQFFIYQGFNASAGWMHTTSGLDSVDEFAVAMTPDRRGYRYGAGILPIQTGSAKIAFRLPDGSKGERSYPIYRTRHGPLVRKEGDKWVSFAMLDNPIAALEQSFLRTKANDHAEFVTVAARNANSSNNTIFADSRGNIAYLHPQFNPRRDDRFDYAKPVDGSDRATAWRGIHSFGEVPRVLNPKTGWIQNTNNWPYSAAGSDSPDPKRFPRYMDVYGENPRGMNAVRLLSESGKLDPQGLRTLAYDRYLSAFSELVPGLVAAWNDPLTPAKRDALEAPIALLNTWDYRADADSVETTLAMYWGEEIWAFTQAEFPGDDRRIIYERLKALPGARKLDALAAAVAKIEADFGSWRTPWGKVNRFQRLTPAIAAIYDDKQASIAVPFASAKWGSLPAFEAAPRAGTKAWYGNRGNSFVAVVEFGPRVRALAVTAGGLSGDPASPHFNDQAARYAAGNLREVRFHSDELSAHTMRTYRPGELPRITSRNASP
jgi:acyl-homoserine-lactone acylase